MAISDNTLYGLTGAQVKDLSDKVATKQYVNNLVGDIETALNEVNNGGGA